MSTTSPRDVLDAVLDFYTFLPLPACIVTALAAGIIVLALSPLYVPTITDKIDQLQIKALNVATEQIAKIEADAEVRAAAEAQADGEAPTAAE